MASASSWKCGVCKSDFDDLDTFAEHECSTLTENDDEQQSEISEKSVPEDEKLSNEDVESCSSDMDESDVEKKNTKESDVEKKNTKESDVEKKNTKESEQMKCNVILNGQKRDETNSLKYTVPTTPFKKLKQTSPWAVVTPVASQNFTCSVCHKNILYKKTSELIAHLNTHGLNQVEIVQNNRTYVLRRENAPYVKSTDVENIMTNHHGPSNSDNDTLVDNSEKEIMLNKIIQFLVKDLLPVSFIQGEGFHHFLRNFDSQFELPSVNVMKQLILQKYTSELVQVQLDISSSNEIHLSLEFWLRDRNQKFVTITLYMGTKDFNLRCYTLKTLCFQDQYDSFLINTTLQLFTLEWNLGNKIEYIVTGKNRPLMDAVLAAGKTNIICLAHSLNDIVKDLFNSSIELTKLLQKCYSLIFIFNIHTAAKEKLLNLRTKNEEVDSFLEYLESEISPTYPVKLEKDCNKYWILKYYVLYQINVLKKISANIGEQFLPDSPLFDSNDWIVLEEVVRIFKMCEVVVMELCTEEFLPLSKVIPILHGLWALTDDCNVTTDCGKKLYKNLLSQLQSNFGTIEENITMAIPTILDPRYKHVVFQSEDAVKVAVRNIVTKSRKYEALSKATVDIATVDPSTLSYVESFWKDCEGETNIQTETCFSDCIIVEELKNFFDEPIISSDKNPFTWWKENGSGRYPLLAEMAKSALSIPASSIPPVRIFMKREKLFFKRRRNIKIKYIDQMLFLNQFMK